jgi:hypothetical protein
MEADFARHPGYKAMLADLPLLEKYIKIVTWDDEIPTQFFFQSCSKAPTSMV